MVADEEPHPTGRKGAAKGSIKAGARTAPAWCPNEGTAVAQWPPRLAPPRLSPWQSCSCSLHTPSLVVGYLDNQLKGRSPAKLGPQPKKQSLLLQAILERSLGLVHAAS